MDLVMNVFFSDGIDNHESVYVCMYVFSVTT